MATLKKKNEWLLERGMRVTRAGGWSAETEQVHVERFLDGREL
jgi:hypothetical protein